MDPHIQTFLNRLSLFSILLATFVLIHLLLTPHPCPIPTTSSSSSSSSSSFPTTSCSSSIHHRPFLPLPNQTLRLLKSPSLSRSHTPSLFLSLNLPLNNSKILLLSAAPGFSYISLKRMGVKDVTAVDVVDSPPYVGRADPHDLPFFDGVFDLAFTDGLEHALFPKRYAGEMERVVRKGGFCVVVVGDEMGEDEVKVVVGLFGKVKVVQGDGGVRNVTVAGVRRTRIVLRVS